MLFYFFDHYIRKVQANSATAWDSISIGTSQPSHEIDVYIGDTFFKMHLLLANAQTSRPYQHGANAQTSSAQSQNTSEATMPVWTCAAGESSKPHVPGHAVNRSTGSCPCAGNYGVLHGALQEHAARADSLTHMAPASNPSAAAAALWLRPEPHLCCQTSR